MSVLEYYKEKQRDRAWYKLYQSSSNKLNGNVFEQTNTNIRSLDTYVTCANILKMHDGVPKSVILERDNRDQDKYRQHKPAFLRMGFIELDSARVYHVTAKGRILTDYLYELYQNNEISDNEEWVLVFLLTLNRKKLRETPGFYLFKTTLEMYSELSCHGYELIDFLNGLKNISMRENFTKDVFRMDIFWLVTFFRDDDFITEYFASSEAEKQELHNYVIHEYGIKSSSDCIAYKIHGDICPFKTFSDETRQVLCIMILLMLQDFDINNFLELYCSLFPGCRYETLRNFCMVHSDIYYGEYEETMGKINEMTEVSLMDRDIEIRLNNTKAALGLPTDEEADNCSVTTSLPERGPRNNNLEASNLILYGPPGTGKTYRTVEYALSIIENDKYPQTGVSVDGTRKDQLKRFNEYIDKGRIVFTTFHQSYDYEDFIQGLRPISNDENIAFKLVDGVFKEIADKAMYDTGRLKDGVRVENNYVIIIDEINRGNISKIFGELITLIDEDKRWGEPEQLKLKLPSGDVFAVPNNLYIIGTMNSSDKSISLLDAALRRRFYFVEVAPDYKLVKNETYKKVLMRLNDKLKEKFNGSTDSLIGHSYFMNENVTLDKIFNNSVIPLLYEYCYDNTKKVKEIVDYALVDTEFKARDADERRIAVTYVGESQG